MGGGPMGMRPNPMGGGGGGPGGQFGGGGSFLAQRQQQQQEMMMRAQQMQKQQQQQRAHAQEAAAAVLAAGGAPRSGVAGSGGVGEGEGGGVPPGQAGVGGAGAGGAGGKLTQNQHEILELEAKEKALQKKAKQWSALAGVDGVMMVAGFDWAGLWNGHGLCCCGYEWGEGGGGRIGADL